jgi:iron complex outermembrane receptor protein
MAAASAASAQVELEDEDIFFQEIPSVYSASKYVQKLTDAPASVTVVTAEEIETYGHRTLGEILGSLPGFYVSYDRNYWYLGVRGFSRPGDYNTRVLLLIDGQRINDGIYESAGISTDFNLDVDLIRRIEVVRGPGSSLYGTNAVFGLVNVITKRGRDLDGVEVSGEYGGFDTYKTRMTYGRRVNDDLEFLVSGTTSDRGGKKHLYFSEFDDPATNDGVYEDNDHTQFHDVFTSVSFRDLSLQASWFSSERGVPTGSYATQFNDPRTETTDQVLLVNLGFQRTLGDKLELKTRLGYGWFGYDGDYVYDYADPGDPPDLVVNRDRARGQWIDGEVQGTTLLRSGHRLSFGGEFRRGFQGDQSNWDEDLYVDEKEKTWSWGAFLQDDIEVTSSLSLLAGFRFDHYDSFGNTVNPRLALVYKLGERTTAKLMYGEAFRAPNLYEMQYHDDWESQKPAGNLDPEKIRTYEAVVETELGSGLRGSAALFYYRAHDVLTLVTDPADDLLIFENTGKIEGKGAELSLEGRVLSDLSGRLSYTFQDVKDREARERATNSPAHMVKLNLAYPLLGDRLVSGLEMQYQSSRRTLAGERSSRAFFTNLTLVSKSLLPGLTLSGSVYNLFDAAIEHPGNEDVIQDVIELDGRSYRVKLTYAF